MPRPMRSSNAEQATAQPLGCQHPRRRARQAMPSLGSDRRWRNRHEWRTPSRLGVVRSEQRDGDALSTALPSSWMTERDAQLQKTRGAGGDVLLDSPLFGLFGQTQGVLSSVAVVKVVEPVEGYGFTWCHSESIHSRPVLCTGLDVPLRTACLPACERGALTNARVLVRTKNHPVERLMVRCTGPPLHLRHDVRNEQHRVRWHAHRGSNSDILGAPAPHQRWAAEHIRQC